MLSTCEQFWLHDPDPCRFGFVTHRIGQVLLPASVTAFSFVPWIAGDSILISSKRQQNSYDHRLRELVFQFGKTETAKRIGVPRSTIHGWTKARPRSVVTMTAKDDYVECLEKRVYLLERRTARLRALLRLCVVLLQLSGFSLAYQRLPQGSDKEKLLRSLDRASRFVRLPRLFAFTGISSSRYYDWKNSQECGLDDVSSCPKSSPGQNDRNRTLGNAIYGAVRSLSSSQRGIDGTIGRTLRKGLRLLLDLVPSDSKWKLDSIS